MASASALDELDEDEQAMLSALEAVMEAEMEAEMAAGTADEEAVAPRRPDGVDRLSRLPPELLARCLHFVPFHPLLSASRLVCKVRVCPEKSAPPPGQ